MRQHNSLTDRQLAWALSGVLFVLCSWPLALVKVLPYQDLPNHLAAITVIEHLDQYPEFVFNGLFKTNTALFSWLLFAHKVIGLDLASHIFSLAVLAANAWVLPRFVLSLTGSRKRMIVGSALSWPMIHNWFVSSGMLNFAMAVPLSLALVILLFRQSQNPSWPNRIGIFILGILTWYCHVFPLLIIHLLVAIEAGIRPTWKERFAFVRPLAGPLLPVSVLVAIALLSQMQDKVGPMTGFVDYRRLLPAWELLYNLWAEWLWGYSKFSVTSIVVAVLLAGIGIWRRRQSPPFFSPLALSALVLLYTFVPYTSSNWFHVNSRIIPFLWVALLLRVPEKLPTSVMGLLGISAVLYSAGMGVDFVRLDRERREFTAGIPFVPERARLLPLLFHHKGSSENTRSLLHYWGYYVVAKRTSAPLLFAHSHSFPVMYSTPPPARFNHLPLEGFAISTATPAALCERLIEGNVTVNDCVAAFDMTWGEFWTDATPRFDHLLLWDITPEARARIPAQYVRVFEQGRLAIYARTEPVSTPDGASPMQPR